MMNRPTIFQTSFWIYLKPDMLPTILAFDECWVLDSDNGDASSITWTDEGQNMSSIAATDIFFVK